jgi:exonuclease SbcC
MRPIKVTMTAFGPYKQKEVVDFTKLGSNRLFVISGSTGAGKTTIFDAICFALYGEASGEERNDSKFLRSHFASDDVHTSVELIFELRGRTYRIFRQLGHVKAGNKTATGGHIELYELTPEGEVPCVDRFNVGDVNAKIESLIGLTKHQFSQIVMLPQGEFRKLLTSETENKEEILRRIFKTEAYKYVVEALNRRRKEAEARVAEERKEREKYISQIPAVLPERADSPLFEALHQEYQNIHQIVQGLEVEADYYKSQMVIHQAKQAKAEEAYRAYTEAYHQAKSVNERFAELTRKRIRAEELEQQIPFIQAQKHILMQAERAAAIEAYEEHWLRAKEDEAAKARELAQAEQAEKEAKERLAQAKQIYEQEEANDAKRREAARETEWLRELLPIVQQLQKKEMEVTARKQQVTQLESQLVKAREQWQASKERKQTLADEIKQRERSVESLGQKQQRLTEMRIQVVVLKRYVELEAKVRMLTQEVETKRAHYGAVLQEYEALERQWLEGQASLLAQHLHEGAPCPVCGSVDHPRKADSQAKIPTKEQLQQQKVEKDKYEMAYLEAEAQLRSEHTALASQAQELEMYGFSRSGAQTRYDVLVAEGKRVSQEVKELEQLAEQLVSLKEAYEQLESQLERQAEQSAQLEKEMQAAQVAYETEKAVYETQLAAIPETFRSLEQLKAGYQAAMRTQEELEANWKRAQQGYQTASEQALKISSDVQHIQKQWAEMTQRTMQAAGRFEQEWLGAGFASMDEYRKSKRAADERDRMKAEIERFMTERTGVQAQIAALEQELHGKERADMDAMLAELTRLKTEYEFVGEAYKTAVACSEHARRLREAILEANEKVRAVEAKLEQVVDLYDIVRGENRHKISFERYLQIEFLEKIIYMANQRLHVLSNGQFQLRRSERLEKRGRQSGLGLDVYDGYTGLTRDVKTLSGGEKFNASLCLALGMADVIQAYQGGISIETMFIDEGFGSLDEESLHKAIDTLIELQSSGRMIGIISHVQELKNAMPAILEVRKEKEGYSRTRFVLKEQ